MKYMLHYILLSVFVSLVVFGVEAERHHLATKTNHSPELTAQLSEEIWNKIPCLGDFRELNTNKPASLTTNVQICYDDDALFVRCIAYDHNLFNRSNDYVKNNAVEVFVLPSLIPTDDYLQIIASPMGQVSHARFGSKKIPPHAYSVAGRISIQDYYIVDFRLPFSTFSTLPKKGERWRLGVARNAKINQRWQFSSLTPAKNLFADTLHFIHLEFPQEATSQDLVARLKRKRQVEYRTLMDDIQTLCKDMESKPGELQRLHLDTTYVSLQKRIEQNKDEKGSKLRQIRNLRKLLSHVRTLHYHYRLRSLTDPQP